MGKDKNQPKTVRPLKGPVVGGQNKVGGKAFITRKSVLGLSNQQMNMVHKLSGAQVEGIDEMDLQGSDSGGSRDGEALLESAYEDLEQLGADL